MGLDEFGTAVPTAQRSDAPSYIEATGTSKPRPGLAGPVQWTNAHGPDVFMACRATYPILPGAVYSLTTIMDEPVFEKQPLNLDDLYFFQDSVAEATINEIETFWASEEKYRRNGFKHRRGYLLYGPQGSGKSSIVLQTQERIVKRGGIAFLCDCAPSLTSKALKAFRTVEPTRPVLCIYEDLDSIIDRFSEPDILTLLDGEEQIDNVLNLATTNYPEKLNRRIIRRPRRFDRVIKVDMPSANVRREYFATKLSQTPADPGAPSLNLDELVKLSNGLSFAAMAEIIISVRCLGLDLHETVKEMKEMQDHQPSSDNYERGATGFRAA